MDAVTHRVAMIAFSIAVAIGYVVIVACMAWESFQHDGAVTDKLVQFGLGSLLIFAVAILGAPVVAQFARMIGIPLPIPPATPPAASPEPPSAPGQGA